MVRIFEDNPHSIGNTPLVRLNRIAPPQVRILVKVEGRNPSYSVKCRVGAAMIWDAEANGLLKQGMELVEPTSGNTGIALAYVCAAKGYKLTLTMPDTMSIERRKLLYMLGADLLLTPGAEGMTGAILRAQQMVDEDPDHYYMPQQFKNLSNPAIHEKTTGPEIWSDSAGQVDVLVAGVGTGGTITGISRYLKSKGRDITSVAVEPANSPVIGQYLAGKPLAPKPHKIQGIGAGFIPDILDLSLVDRVEQVSDEDAMVYARRLAMEEGILAGISSGAAVAAALKLAHLPEFEGKTMVVILPDSSERYLSSDLYKGIGEG